MKDSDCVLFLQWALPQLHMRWKGFRKVRAQACKKVARRMHRLHIESVEHYRTYLQTHPQEWDWLDTLSHITISRFYRDQAVFTFLESDIFPALVNRITDREQGALRVWSIGCCSGEEPYSISLMWKLQLQPRYPDARLEVIATDADAKVIKRAKSACYLYSSIKSLPKKWHHRLFDLRDGLFCLKPAYRGDVHFIEQDARIAQPDGLFDLVLCRNLVFTYFDQAQQHKTLERIHAATRPGGVLVIGMHENLPEGAREFNVCSANLRVFSKGLQ